MTTFLVLAGVLASLAAFFLLRRKKDEFETALDQFLRGWHNG